MDANKTRMTEGTQVPERLWKYRTWDKHASAMIEHGELYFAKLNEINDPFEFRWREHWPSERAERDLFFRKLCEKEFPNDSIEQRRNRFSRLMREGDEKEARSRKCGGSILSETIMRCGVFSVSENYTHPLMWSHYADSHSGICIGLSTSKIQRKIFRPVVYLDDIPIVSIWEYVNDSSDGLFADIASRKSTVWSYEKEWRTIDSSGTHLFPGCVSDVIIGSKCSHQNRREIETLASQSDTEIMIHQSRLSENHYSLDIKPPVTV